MNVLAIVVFWILSFCSPILIAHPCYCPDSDLQASFPCDCSRVRDEMNECGECFMDIGICGDVTDEECGWYLLAY